MSRQVRYLLLGFAVALALGASDCTASVGVGVYGPIGYGPGPWYGPWGGGGIYVGGPIIYP